MSNISPRRDKAEEGVGGRKKQSDQRSRGLVLTSREAKTARRVQRAPPALSRLLLRISRPHFRDDDESRSDDDQEKGKKLAAGDARDKARIRLAETFDDNAKNCVTDEKQPGQKPVRLARSRAHKPKDQRTKQSLRRKLRTAVRDDAA